MTPAGRGDPVALVATPAHGTVAVTTAGPRSVDVGDVRRIESTTGPRWVWWSAPSVSAMLADVSIARAFDLAAVHRVLHGGWQTEPARVWALAHELDPEAMPRAQPPDLFDQGPTPAELAEPIGPDGHLRPEWPAGEWSSSADRAATWGALALRVASAQQAQLAALAAERRQVTATARAESAAEVLCIELGRDGLPIDRRADIALYHAVADFQPAGHAGEFRPHAAEFHAIAGASRGSARHHAVKRRFPADGEIANRDQALLRGCIAGRRVERHPHGPAVHPRITVDEAEQRAGIPGLEIKCIAPGPLAAQIARQLGVAAKLGVHAEGADLAAAAGKLEIKVAQRLSIEADHGAKPQIEVKIDRRFVFCIGTAAGDRRLDEGAAVMHVAAHDHAQGAVGSAIRLETRLVTFSQAEDREMRGQDLSGGVEFEAAFDLHTGAFDREDLNTVLVPLLAMPSPS